MRTIFKNNSTKGSWMEMDQEKYDKIKAFVKLKVVMNLRNQHLEDCVQYVAMKVSEDGKRYWGYLVIDYFRAQGFGKRGKVGAKVLASSVFVGQGNDEGNCESLLEQEAGVEHEPQGVLHRFLCFFKIEDSARNWACSVYRKGRRWKHCQ